MKPKRITLPDGSVIIDGLSRLIIKTKAFVDYSERDFHTKINLMGLQSIPCKASLFTTKKGREAILIELGETHRYHEYWGSGSKYWRGWENSKPVNAIFAEAKATSNGGGCWLEVWVMEAGVDIVTAEQKEYIEEL